MTNEEAIRLGFAYALDQYGVWKDGVQRIGCMERPIKEVLEEFDRSGKARQLVAEKPTQLLSTRRSHQCNDDPDWTDDPH